MKKLAFIAVIVACLSAAYHFGIYLPKIHNFKMQEECTKITKEFMAKENFGNDSVKYECHFNKKFNRCFARIESSDLVAKSVAHTLVDILENKDYGACLEYEHKVNPLSCSMVDKKNKMKSYPNYYGWRDATEEYMNE